MNFPQSDVYFLLDELPDLILLLDLQGKILYVNRSSQQVLEERFLIGRQFHDLIDRQDLARCPQHLEDWIDWRSERQEPWEIRIRLKDGKTQLVSGCAKSLTLPAELVSDNDSEGILLSLRAIGQPDGANVRRNLLVVAIEAADSSIVIADAERPDLPLIYVNRGFIELTGYPEADILGQNCRFLQYTDSDETTCNYNRPELEKLRHAIANRESANVVLRNYRQDGSLFYNELYITPVYERERLTAFVGVQNDITQRIEAQQQLKKRENILSSLFTATDVLLGVVELVDAESYRHLIINDRAQEFFQLDETATLITAKTQWYEAFTECQKTKETVRFEWQLERSGQMRYLKVTVNPIETEPGEALRCCYVAEDLTELHDAENRRMLMEAAVENTDESIIITTPKLDRSDNNPEIVYVNPAFTEITGYERNEALGKTPRILQGMMTDPAVLDRLREGLIENQSFRGETINYRKDGEPFVIQWNITPILDEEQSVTHWVASQRDVTRRRQLEKEVLEIQAQEQERIARDLHDSIQQKLNVIGMLASLIQHQLDKEPIAKSKELLQRLFDTTRTANEQVRAIARSLYPVSIERNGLMTALQHLATTTKEIFNIDCQFTFEQPILTEDRALVTYLYRIVQEAINNAIRHGAATQILIGIARKHKEDRYTLTISDNGTGISDKDRTENGGIGLNSMGYRAEIISADLSIENRKNGGTIVTCTFTC